MEIRQLRYFISVAEHLNFTQAAKKLFVAQPAISQQIASLEKKMGLKLFERDKHSVRLTHAGKVFLDDAIELLEKTEESINRAKKAAVGEIGHLSIGFLYAPVKNFLPSFIKSFREKYPSVQISMNHYQTAEVIEKLTNNDVDIAFIMSFKPEDRAEWEYHSLFSQPYCVFIDQHHPLAKKQSISIKELTNEPIVMLDRKESPHGYDHLITLFASHGSLPNISMHTERIETVLMLVESGLGVAILPKHLHVYANPSIRCIEIMDWKHTVDIGVAWKKENANPSIALFLNELEMKHFPQYNKIV
ncbi:LysR family transcriptional regulator [Psychrobacillus sp. NPDC096426]|uniref:LysR family transcriptional regulator n=1 Tax=Psychrobacillus sp. NPDC096426 TaxID=3364491 RepID=UPI003800F1EA